MKIVGFDFGTTNSLISFIQGDRAYNLFDDGQPYPSVISYEGSRVIVGQEAKKQLGQAGLGIKGNTVRSPKVLLGRDSVHIEGLEYSPIDIVSDVVSYIAQHSSSKRQWKEFIDNENGVIKHAVVTIPIDMEGHKRKALRDAFRLANITIIQFIHEPLAALYGFFRSQKDMAATLRNYDRKLLLVFDWGGGTLDLTLCRLLDGRLIQIVNDGTDEIGGDTFDEAIKNEVIRQVGSIRNLDESVAINLNAEIRLLHRCEEAKIALSTKNKVEIYIPSFFKGIDDDSLEYTLTPSELNNIVEKFIDKGLTRINNILHAADVSPAQVSLCLATGGMVNMPIIKTRLHQLFGAQRVQISDSSGTLIAEGAAWVAHDKAKLHMAKNIELLLARNSYMPLIRTNTIMPSESEIQKDQFHLYCSDPRDGHAKFQLCAPVRSDSMVMPNSHRNFLANLIVDVDDKALPFQERIELDIEMNDDLILKATARSLNKKDMAETEIHNIEFGLSIKKDFTIDELDTKNDDKLDSKKK